LRRRKRPLGFKTGSEGLRYRVLSQCKSMIVWNFYAGLEMDPW